MGLYLILTIVSVVIYCFIYSLKTKKVISKNLSTFEKILSPIGMTDITYENLISIDSIASDNVFSLVKKYGLSENDIFDTNSSIGICAFTNNCLITSLEAHVVRQDYISTDELFSLFKNYNPEENNKIVNKIFHPRDQAIPDEVFEEFIGKYKKHLKKMVKIIAGPLKITSGRVIKAKNIEYFKFEGAAQYVSDVKGGGANLAGALYGSIIGGGAGAVVGSHLGTEIKTDIIRKDDRQLFLCYYVDGVLKNEEIITDNIDYVLSLLREWMPDKEYSHVTAQRSINPIVSKALPYVDSPKIEEHSPPVRRSYSELKELKELLDLGIITQEEFDRKKREILG